MPARTLNLFPSRLSSLGHSAGILESKTKCPLVRLDLEKHNLCDQPGTTFSGVPVDSGAFTDLASNSMTPRMGGLVREAENPRLASAMDLSTGEEVRLTKGATWRTFRRVFAAHLPGAGYEIPSVEEFRA